MPLVSHLTELRTRLLRCVAAIFIIFAGLFAFTQQIYTFVSTPLRDYLPAGATMIATDVSSPFLTPLKLTMMVSLFLAIPVILHQIWGFIAPGLYKHEKRIAVPLLVSSILLFYTGMAFAYFLVFPLIFKFFAAATPAGVEMMTDITSYLDFVMTLFFAFGVAFEIPVAVVLLVWIGVVDVKYLKKIRPYVIIGCFVVGMILTPPDIFSQTLLAVPMWMLFEIGILFGSLVSKPVNLLLLEEADFIAADRVVLRDRRLVHMQEVHRAAVGDSLRVGRIGGLMGNAQLLRLEAREAELEVTFDQPPPAKLPLTLLLALPRPKMLRRVLQTVASMGVPRVVLVNSYRVEKSFWQTPFLEPEAIREQLILGLEQARDTVLPEIVIEKRFKPFVEDRLPAMAQGTLGLIGHPGDYPPCPRGLDEPVTLAIGPEGGWIPYEVDLLAKAGLQPVQLGARILRVETAVTALLARLF
eukprot:gene4166-6468_t